MKPKEILEEWEEGDNGLRPQRIQQVREDLAEATGMHIPRRISVIESYMERMQSQITRKLREAVEDAEDDD